MPEMRSHISKVKSTSKKFVLLLLLFLTQKGFGQSDYYQGFIIQNNSDTTYGSILLRAVSKNQREVKFKSENGQVTEFTPGEIFGYYVSGKKFYVTETIAINETEKEVFLEFLVDGIVDLYFFSESNRDYFFLKKDGRLHLLNNSVSEISTGNSQYVKEKEEYKGTLTYLMQDAPGLKSRIENAQFSPNALSKISTQYHEKTCDDYECINYRKTEKNQLSLEPSLSFVSSNMTLASSDQNDRNSTMQAGLSLKIRSKRNYRLNSVIGVHYSTEEFSGVFTNSILNQRLDHRLNVSYSLIRIPIGLEYQFKANESSPFLGLYFNNIFLSNWEYDILQRTFLDNF